MSTPDLVEDSAEVEFAKRVMVEDRKVVADESATSVAIDGAPAGMEDRLREFGREFDGMCRDAESLDGGKVYRGEVALAGFTMIRSCFGFRNGASGWFFGSHPEFYFTRLPLSLVRIASLLVLPPVLVVVGLWVSVCFSVWFDRFSAISALLQP